MTPGGLSALLPSRLTESTVWSEDRIWLEWTHSLWSLWFLLTGEVTAAGAGSTAMASTHTKLTWDWVLSVLSPTTGRGWAPVLTVDWHRQY